MSPDGQVATQIDPFCMFNVIGAVSPHMQSGTALGFKGLYAGLVTYGNGQHVVLV